MSYHKVYSSVWDNETFRDLSELGKIVWFALLTGPQVTALPGLQRASAASLAETVGSTPQDVADVLRILESKNFIEVDRKRPVIRIPSVSDENTAASPNHIKAWWTRWNEIPSCNIREKHLESLKKNAALTQDTHAEVWAKTFGTIGTEAVMHDKQSSSKNAESEAVMSFARNLQKDLPPDLREVLSKHLRKVLGQDLREDLPNSVAVTVDLEVDVTEHQHSLAHARAGTPAHVRLVPQPSSTEPGHAAQAVPANDVRPESGGERVVAINPTLATEERTGPHIDDFLQEIVLGASGKKVFEPQASAQLKAKLWEDVRSAGYTLRDFRWLGATLALTNRPKGIPADPVLSVAWLTSRPETLCRAIEVAREAARRYAADQKRATVPTLTPEEIAFKKRRSAEILKLQQDARDSFQASLGRAAGA